MPVLKQFLCGIFGICAGLVTAGGYFAIISTLNVIPRYAQFTHTARKIRLYELALIIGTILGNIMLFVKIKLDIPVGPAAAATAFMGIFVGCFLVSLAEMVKGFPVFSRRARIKKGFGYIILGFAIGKLLGNFFYFFA